MRVSAGGASSAAVLLDGSVVVWGGGVPLRVLFERSAAAGASFQDGGSDAVDVACAAGNVITLFESGRLATRRCVGAAASASAAEVEGEGGAAAAVSAATLATDHGEVGGGGANADADAAAAPARPSPAQRPIAIVAGATGRVLGCALHGAVLRGALYAGGGETLPQWRPLTLAPIRVLGRVRALCVACGDAHSAVVTQVRTRRALVSSALALHLRCTCAALALRCAVRCCATSRYRCYRANFSFTPASLRAPHRPRTHATQGGARVHMGRQRARAAWPR